VRKPLRYTAYALLICLTLLLIPAGILLLFDTWQRIKVDRYYAERPILQAMRSVHDGVWSNNSEPARSALLQHVTLGTDSQSATAALSIESFSCAATRRPSNESSRYLGGLEHVEVNGARLNCQLLAPARLGYTRWLIDLWFDESKRLLDVKVAIWNVFL
jgi:hypothetical protein